MDGDTLFGSVFGEKIYFRIVAQVNDALHSSRTVHLTITTIVSTKWKFSRRSSNRIISPPTSNRMAVVNSPRFRETEMVEFVTP